MESLRDFEIHRFPYHKWVKMYSVCQNLYKNYMIILLDYWSKIIYLCIVTEHVLKHYQFTFPQNTRIHNTRWWISYNYVAVGVVFMLFFISIVIQSQCFPYPNLFFIWKDKKSRKWNEIFEAKWINVNTLNI